MWLIVPPSRKSLQTIIQSDPGLEADGLSRQISIGDPSDDTIISNPFPKLRLKIGPMHDARQSPGESEQGCLHTTSDVQGHVSCGSQRSKNVRAGDVMHVQHVNCLGPVAFYDGRQTR